MTRKRIAWQLIRSFSLLIAVSLLSFILIVSSPIDPVEAYIGADKAISEKQRQSIIDYWGLDKEPLERFGLWIKNLIHGGFYRLPKTRYSGNPRTLFDVAGVDADNLDHLRSVRIRVRCAGRGF